MRRKGASERDSHSGVLKTNPSPRSCDSREKPRPGRDVPENDQKRDELRHDVRLRQDALQAHMEVLNFSSLRDHPDYPATIAMLRRLAPELIPAAKSAQ